jgi:hypothetical protein
MRPNPTVTVRLALLLATLTLTSACGDRPKPIPVAPQEAICPALPPRPDVLKTPPRELPWSPSRGGASIIAQPIVAT